MTSQFLFGELVEILEDRKTWLRVRMSYDGYEGWIPDGQLHPLSGTEYKKFLDSWNYYSLDTVATVKEGVNASRMHVVLGSAFPRQSRGHFRVGKLTFSTDARMRSPVKETTRQDLVRVAKKYLGAPYLWGGRSPFGIDCSGLVQMVFRINHIKLPRDAWQQALLGEPLGFLTEAKAGDLAFFDDEEGKIVHAGIILNPGSILHASGKVRIDKLDHQGIFDTANRKYTHKLRIVKSHFAEGN